jgi:hypothetical protein
MRQGQVRGGGSEEMPLGLKDLISACRCLKEGCATTAVMRL